MDSSRIWDGIRPILTALVILGIVFLLALFIYSFNIDVAVKGSLIGVIIGGGLTFLGQMWSQDVNNTHQLRMAKIDYENQLRMAALDKRLQAHQEAFARWNRIFWLANAETEDERQELHQVYTENYTWWYGNCLYLTKEAAEAFYKAIQAAPRHQNYRVHAEMSQEEKDQINQFREENWAKLESARDIIASGIGLPSPNTQELSKDKEDL